MSVFRRLVRKSSLSMLLFLFTFYLFYQSKFERVHLTEPCLNISDIIYVVRPDTIESECQRGRLWLLIIVHSAVGHLKKRHAIRQTWASVTGLDGRQIRTVFLLGQTENTTQHNSIFLESQQFSDILQGSFHDTYRNLTYKNLMGLRWISETCDGELKYVLKTDDDVFVNLYGLYSVVKKWDVQVGKETMSCLLTHRSRVHRSGRYAVGKALYAGDFYPEHCVGMAYLISQDAVPALYTAALTSPFLISPDDAFLGILREKTSVKLHKLNHIYTLKESALSNCIKHRGRNCPLYFGPARPQDMPVFWEKVQE